MLTLYQFTIYKQKFPAQSNKFLAASSATAVRCCRVCSAQREPRVIIGGSTMTSDWSAACHFTKHQMLLQQI